MSPNVWLRHPPPHQEKAVFSAGPRGRAAAKGSPGTVIRRDWSTRHTLQPCPASQLKCSRCGTIVKKDQIS